MNTRTLKIAAVLTAAAFVSFGASAAELKVGLSTEVDSLDPHYDYEIPDVALHLHLYDTLILNDEKQRLIPGLATSWKPIDDTTWEFTLRKGVKFHDGTDFDANDVAFSVQRVNTLKALTSFKMFVSKVTEVVVVDPYTVRFKTKDVYPMLPGDISQVMIASDSIGKATTADFNSGKAAIGTGPFKLVEFITGNKVVVAANEKYWGGKPVWDKVTDGRRRATQGRSQVDAGAEQLQPRDLSACRYRPRPDAERQGQEGGRTVKEPLKGSPRPAGDLESDQPRSHQGPRHGRPVDSRRAASAAGLLRDQPQPQAGCI
jgi:hypothetical protein